MTGAKAKAVILAAGLGTRLRPLTDTVPKCLIPIGKRPLLDYWLVELERAGVHDVLINTHHHRAQVEDFVGLKNRTSSLRVETTYEPELLGSAGTIHSNPAWMDDAEDCVIIYPDNFSSVVLADFLRFHRSHPDPFTMMLFHAPVPSVCGIVEVDSQGTVVGFEEKPPEPMTDLANAGLYAVSAAAYREIAAMDRFDLGYDILPAFVGRTKGWVFGGYHRDICDREALESARADAAGIFGSASEG